MIRYISSFACPFTYPIFLYFLFQNLAHFIYAVSRCRSTCHNSNFFYAF